MRIQMGRVRAAGANKQRGASLSPQRLSPTRFAAWLNGDAAASSSFSSAGVFSSNLKPPLQRNSSVRHALTFNHGGYLPVLIAWP
jgi:hypothetical protein